MKPNRFLFYVESTGQLKASEIVKKVLNHLGIILGIWNITGETWRSQQRVCEMP